MSKKDILKETQKAFRLTFGNETAKDVLAELRVFCNATTTTYNGDTNQMLIDEGRRQVFLYIMSMLKVDVEQVYEMDINYPDDEF